MELQLNSALVQKLTLTPQLRQSVEILQMSSFDLTTYMQERALENPFIEISGDSFAPIQVGSSRGTASIDQGRMLQHHSSEELTLETVLLEQLNELQLDKTVYRLCKLIIGSLDERGYLAKEMGWMAEQMATSMETVRMATGIIQLMEPYGVAAASLEECLLIQMERLGEKDSLVLELVKHELNHIAQGRLLQLASKYSVSLTEIQTAVDKISMLNPNPGAAYQQEKIHYIKPDLLLKCQPDGSYELGILEASTPTVTISSIYMDMMKCQHDKNTAQYLRNNWKAAKWLLQSISQRKSTLLQVGQAIFAYQTDFCMSGTSQMRPMSLKHIAQKVQLHESTICRAVNGKYVRTPWGLFELKHFFTSAIRHTDGEDVSALRVKDSIRHLIKEEDKAAPLSDQKITDLLRRDGILIARRTVTKYREQLHLYTAAERKRQRSSCKFK
ncbi:RNA polymerase sigma-54 factor [Paenibacillus baekrokdamisoli]|uniref:RNA polymerase sigma-54 factor n=1 Tax=Paenibacillus baekrokdamisoli TaxID=1712516 RepID=A0A3G9J8C2_9BACL|nr:RNA polymerase factor sigma-54 [Paenibacillus baekrokdamisoli]MBB3070729.1 RNA polymerase sigma-54 factor [Paenibacillus baekrokdamisoli]BBH20078.1 RNA polymerase sigma-54 factor [Paenibacillus baekrokdamisoli]